MLIQNAFDALPAHVAVLNADGVITNVNERWTRFARDNGNPPASKIGVGASYLAVCRRAEHDTPAARQVIAGLEDLLSGSEEHYVSVQYPCHSTSEKRWFIMLASAMPRNRAGAVVLHLNISKDRLSREQLGQSARNLIVAQEEERRRVARDLHDDLNQLIATLAFDLGMLRKEVPGGLNQVRDELRRLKSDAVSLSERVRRISHELHPATLEHLGVGTALKNYCDEVCGRVDAELDFDSRGEPRDLDSVAAVALFRIGQEAIRNAIKHSRAGRIHVELAHLDEQIELAVSDDGVGFEVERIDESSSGLGLVSMRERANLAEGRLNIESKPGQGTVVRAVVPVRGRADDETYKSTYRG